MAPVKLTRAMAARSRNPTCRRVRHHGRNDGYGADNVQRQSSQDKAGGGGPTRIKLRPGHDLAGATPAGYRKAGGIGRDGNPPVIKLELWALGGGGTPRIKRGAAIPPG